MPRKKATCTLEMGDTYQRGSIDTQPLSRGGWARAKDAAMAHAKATGHVAMVDLKCAGGRIPLYQCNRDYKDKTSAYCVIETFHDPHGHATAAIAGARGRRRRRR